MADREAQLERQLKEAKALLTAAVLSAGGQVRLCAHEIHKLMLDGVKTEIMHVEDPARVILTVRL